jgi:hypothetical protein
VNTKDILKASVAGAALFAVAVPATTTPASADGVMSGNKNSLTMSGQVNRAVLYMDDGDNAAIANVDTDSSSTRIRWIAKGKLNEAVTFGTNIEMQAESNSSSQVNIQNHRGINSGTNGFNQRKMELYIDHKQFGRLWVGQGDTASNGTAEVDLSGSTLLGYSGNTDTASNVAFVNSLAGSGTAGANSQAVTAKTSGNVNSNFDGLSRDDRLRYDTPSFAGFKLSTSYVANSQWDVAARYSGKFGGVKVGLAASYANPSANSSTVKSNVTVSGSAKHDSGLGVALSWGKRNLKASGSTDPDGIYAKLFYDAKLFSTGTTAFFVDYSSRDDVNAAGDEAESFGIGVVQKFSSVGSELYLGYRNFSLDNATTNYEDISIVIAGARVKF